MNWKDRLNFRISRKSCARAWGRGGGRGAGQEKLGSLLSPPSSSPSVCDLHPIQFSSVTQSCLTLCNPMNRSTPGLPVHHQLPESTQTHVHWCHPVISSSVISFSSCPQSLPASGSFQMSQLFASGGQSIGASASTSVLPMNTQEWPPLGWTGWISLQSKGFSRVFSNTTVQKHHSSALSFVYSPTLTSIRDHWKNRSLD